MNWSGPNVIHFGRKSRFGPDQFILVVTISFWSWPNHYFQIQINLVRPKPFCTDQNCFGHIEGQGIKVHLIFQNEFWLFLGEGHKKFEIISKLFWSDERSVNFRSQLSFVPNSSKKSRMKNFCPRAKFWKYFVRFWKN